ncbi:MAG: cytochrome c biogenesis protein ResB [bacterium]
MKKVINILTSMRLAIVLIIIISTISIIGAIIPQNKSYEYYIYKYGVETTKLIETLYFNRIFSSLYFIVLIVILSLSIIICTIRQFPKLISKFKKPLMIERIDELDAGNLYIEMGVKINIDDLKKILSTIGYCPFERVEGDVKFISARKGLLSPLGFLFTHLGIIIIFIGGIIGACYRSSQEVALFEGETGLITVKDGGYSIRADRIEIERDPNTDAIVSYSAQVTLFKSGEKLKSDIIEVNKPLNYSGVSIFLENIGNYRGIGLSFIKGDSFDHIKNEVVFYVYVKGDDFEGGISGRLGDSISVGEKMVLRFDDFYSNFMRIGKRDTNDNPAPNPCLTYTIIENKKTIYNGFAFLYHPSVEMVRMPMNVRFLGIEPANSCIHLIFPNTPFPICEDIGGVIKIYGMNNIQLAKIEIFSGNKQDGEFLYDGCPIKISDNLYAILVGSKIEECSTLSIKRDLGFGYFLCGAIIMCLGICIMLFIRYREIKVLIREGKVFISGKAKETDRVFDRDFRRFVLLLEDKID